MNFVSAQFAVFFIGVFVVYWALPRKGQNLFLLLASWVFYAAWDWRFLSLIIISTVVDFIAGRRIYETEEYAKRRAWLLVSLVVNLGILGYFKYANFFLDSFISLANSVGMNVSAPTLQIILPVGISFYTFQTLSYSLDIHLRRLEPTKSIIDFGAFVAFFPQLVAGPIVRAREFLYQLDERRTFDVALFERGAVRFLTGFFKKAVIADSLALYLVDPVFADPGAYGTGTLWLASFGYTAQIYADFSGYSSMAIGSAMMLGFHIPENFDFPYLAKSFSEFWTRWHITMSRFFRDYVYIPLGGSRVSAMRTRWNLAATTLISGLWHGASWTFVAWGGLHGLFIMIGHTLRGDGRSAGPLKYALGWIATFMGVHLAWILFRSTSFTDAWIFVTGLFGQTGETLSASPVVWFALGAVVVDHIAGAMHAKRPVLKDSIHPALRAAFLVFLVVVAYHVMPREANPFIYFQF